MSTKILKVNYVFWGERTKSKYTSKYDLDTIKGRFLILEDYCGELDEEEDLYDEERNFINGKSNVLDIEADGRDWDDPTAYHFEILTKEEAKKQIEEAKLAEFKAIDEL